MYLFCNKEMIIIDMIVDKTKESITDRCCTQFRILSKYPICLFYNNKRVLCYSHGGPI